MKYLISLFIALSFVFSASADMTTTKDLLNASKNPENWITHHGTLDGQRYSGLKQINKKNH